ncbi:BTAD domain-containing putative transcriptional regulator [Allokutzneria sp. NRRL B-24872]|uniref:AfsR/SARP family transcriptional regulator n=1 Tax=Allokutzneria sp. NRRL B-24872 TaxID=1137961 RepID=UPI000A372A7E|nr:BTAD domain-containing putative transcriptional regulator [Allokutzneria sp. NRRL B-24872]
MRVLGQFEVLRGGVAITPTPPKMRQVFALLAVNANSVVRTESFMEELWGPRPPSKATTTLQTYVSHLRKILASSERAELADSVLRTHRVGYSLDLPSESLDVQHFAELAQRGRTELESGMYENAADSLRSALAVWRGSALSDVQPGPVLKTHIARLEESRSSVTEQRMEVDLLLGRHHQLIAELSTLVRQYPTHEGLHGKLMLALHRAGRRSEALRVFQTIRSTLVAKLGIEPGPELQRLHRSLLAGGTDHAAESTASGLTVVRDSGREAAWGEPPAQLPPDLPAFIGRSDELAKVEALMLRPPSSAPPVVSVTGPPGSGKSAFCVHAANRVRARFQQGQLYADLATTEPAEVLAGFLRALRGPHVPLPAALEERSQLFRSWTAQRKILVVLDNATSAAQVAPLVPTGQRCAVIVSCRRRLHWRSVGLMLDLPPLSPSESTDLLASVIGQARAGRDDAAAAALLRLCGGSPLAVLAAATRLALRPHWSVARLVERLGAEDQRLRELTSGKLDVRASVEASVEELDADTRAAFLALAPHAREPLPLEDAAKLLNLDEYHAESVLERLVEFHLAIPETGGAADFAGWFRYRVPPLFRLTAQAMADADAVPGLR